MLQFSRFYRWRCLVRARFLSSLRRSVEELDIRETLNLATIKVIPAERRGPEKEETWTLAPDQSGVDACPFLDDVLPDVKSKPIQDDNPNPVSTILAIPKVKATNSWSILTVERCRAARRRGRARRKR
ncbi:hypothetical protein HZU67_00658 [Apis mellifera carnica]|nr:hypothetical protein HZU67_00658 [Apis mellifera carnica]